MFAQCTLPILLLLAAPEPAKTLAWKFKEGDVFFLRTETTIKTTATIEGMKTEHSSAQGGVSRFTVQKVNKDGSVTIKEDVLSAVQKVDGKDFQPLIDAFEGSTFAFTLKSDGGIEGFEGHKEFVKKMKPQQREKETAAEMETQLKHALAQRFGIFPNKALSPGDTWQRKSTVRSAMNGVEETTTKYRYEGKAKASGQTFDRVSLTSTKEVRPSEPDAGPAPGFRLVACKIIEQECKGSLFFDPAAGRLHQLTTTRQFKEKRTIAIGKKNTDFDFAGVEKTTITLLKEYP